MPLVIENSKLKLGVDPERGGAICWLGRGGSGESLLNAYDCGRYIQQRCVVGARILLLLLASTSSSLGLQRAAMHTAARVQAAAVPVPTTAWPQRTHKKHTRHKHVIHIQLLWRRRRQRVGGQALALELRPGRLLAGPPRPRARVRGGVAEPAAHARQPAQLGRAGADRGCRDERQHHAANGSHPPGAQFYLVACCVHLRVHSQELIEGVVMSAAQCDKSHSPIK